MKWELPHQRERGQGSEPGRCLLVKWELFFGGVSTVLLLSSSERLMGLGTDQELPHQHERGQGSEPGRCLLVKWELFFGGVSTVLLLSSSERLMGLGTDQEPETAVGVVNNGPLSVTPE